MSNMKKQGISTMPQVFAMQADRVNFQLMELELSDLLSLLTQGVSLDRVVEFNYQYARMTSWWKVPKTRFLQTNGSQSAIPDVSVWADATLVLSSNAYDHLSDTLKLSGEFLPVRVGHESFYFFICFAFGNRDFSKSQSDEAVLGPDGLFFERGTEDLVVFKSVVRGSITLFCSERLKHVIESSRLSGLMFRQAKNE